MSRVKKKATEASTCRSCDALILWAKWERSGKRMPVDAGPNMADAEDGGGDLVLTLRGGEFGELIVEKFHAPKHGPKRNRYTSHFATCPNAKQHRSGKGE